MIREIITHYLKRPLDLLTDILGIVAIVIIAATLYVLGV